MLIKAVKSSVKLPRMLSIRHRDNININDALGDYSLTLVDALDSLAVSYSYCVISTHVLLVCQVMGNNSEFQHAVKLVINHVSFDKCSTVQVFEANIR